MKIEIEVTDELVKKFGIEAIKIFLSQKAVQMEKQLDHPATEHPSENETDLEAVQKAWANFNKRGPSC